MWNHFLIKIEWLEELLGYIKGRNIHYWSELFREMSIYSINRHFAWKSFLSLKEAFHDFNLAEKRDDNKLILTFNENLSGHLETLILKNNPEVFDIFYESWHRHNYTDFQIWKKLGGVNYPEAKRGRIYTQQIELLKYLSLGIITEKSKFLPFEKMLMLDNDPVGLMKVILNFEDPRIIGYKYSRHPERDYLVYSQGKNFLPLADQYSSEISFNSMSILSATGGIDSKRLKRELINFSLKIYDLSGFRNAGEFDNFIFTLKYLLGSLFFGNASFSKQSLNTYSLDLFEGVLNKYSIKLKARGRQDFSILYKSISSLFLNSVYLNRYIHRPASLFTMSDNLVNYVNLRSDKELRMLNNRTSASSLYASIHSLVRLNNQLDNKTRKQEIKTDFIKRLENDSKFLTGDLIERRDLLNKLKEYYYISAESIDRLIHYKPIMLSDITLRSDELLNLIELIYIERVTRSKTVKLIKMIKEFLKYKYYENLRILKNHSSVMDKHLDNLNLRQFLNILDDQKVHLDKDLRFKYNSDIFEYLDFLLYNTSGDKETLQVSTDSELRFALKRFLIEYKSRN